MKGFRRGLATLMAAVLVLGNAPVLAEEDATVEIEQMEPAPEVEQMESAQPTPMPEGGEEIIEPAATEESAEGTIQPTESAEVTAAPEEIAEDNEETAAPEEIAEGNEEALLPADVQEPIADDLQVMPAEEDLSGVTDPVDNSTTLADGTYEVENFAFSGGTGKTKITCEKVTVTGGKVTATIQFSSSKYGYVKAGGGKYDPISTDGGAKFEIPVDLNVANRIIGMTTGMTEPHEIEYSITVTLTEPEEKPGEDFGEDLGYEDGDYTIGITSGFTMFKVVSSTVKVSGGKATVTLSTAKKTYDRIYLGAKNDEMNYPGFIQGTLNAFGGYDFTFELPASSMGQEVDFVPGKPDGTWYSKKQYQLTIPAALEKPVEPEPVKTFEVKNVYAEQADGILNVVLTSDSADFDRIFIGSIGTASKTPYYVRRTMADGTYYYEFTLSAANLGREVRFVPGCPDGTWLDQQMTFTVPEITALPERPEEEAYGDGNYTASVPVYVDGGTGLASSAMDALYTEVTVQGDFLTVTIWNRSTSYNQLYVGKLGDADVTVIDRVEDSGKYSDAYYRYTFTLPKSALGTLVPIVPGKDGEWASKQNYMAIPKYLSPAASTPVEPDDPEPAAPVEDGEYNIEVDSNAGMFKVIACKLTAKDGKYTAVLTLSGTGYDKLFVGTAEEAANADASAYIPFVEDAEGKYTYTVPVEALDKGIAIAAHSLKNDRWYDRTLTFKSSTLDKVEKALEDGEYSVNVDSDSGMFKVVACKLTAKDGKYTALLTLSGTGYDKLFVGTAEEANNADASAHIPFVEDAEGKYTYTVPVEALDKGIAIAAHSLKNDRWYDRTLTFKSEGLTKVEDVQPTPTPEPTPTPTPEPTEKPEDDLSGSTSRVDASTSLADGTYTPDKFSYSGGTGRVSLSCTQVTVKNGKATATIVFGSPNFSYVKANGQKIYGSHGGGTSTFEVPVKLNANNRLIGMTTAMSANHEVSYTIYVYIEGANGEKSAESGEAPRVAGLNYKSSDAIDHAEYFRVYRYEEGVIVIDVKDVVRYMIAPEGIELPVGADDGMIRVDRPVDSVYVGSDEVLTLLADADQAALCDSITRVGCKQEDCPAEAIARRMAEERILYAGTYDAPDYAQMLKAGNTLAVMPADYADSAVLGTDDALESQLEPEFAQDLLKVSERLDMLKVALFVDRSTDETTEEGRLEWIKVYGILFDCEDAAQTAYHAAIA